MNLLHLLLSVVLLLIGQVLSQTTTTTTAVQLSELSTGVSGNATTTAAAAAAEVISTTMALSSPPSPPSSTEPKIELNPNTEDLVEDPPEVSVSTVVSEELSPLARSSEMTSALPSPSPPQSSFPSVVISTVEMEKPVIKFDLVKETPQLNLTVTEQLGRSAPLSSQPSTWSSSAPAISLSPSPIPSSFKPIENGISAQPKSAANNKLGKRFFRKKVISTYDYANRKKGSTGSSIAASSSSTSASSSDPYKNYYRFKFSPKEQPHILQQQQQQQQQSPNTKGLSFLQNFAPFKRTSAGPTSNDGGSLLEKKITRFSSLRRRSDPSSLVSGGPNAGNAWWTKYLSQGASLVEGETGQQQASLLSPPPQMVSNFPAGASLSPAFYNAPDYVHNPATSATFLTGGSNFDPSSSVGNGLVLSPSEMSSQGSLPSGTSTSADTAGLLNFWLTRLYSNALPYIDLALMTAAYAQQAKKAKEEEEEKNSFKGRIKALYGRNKLYKQATPAKKFFSKLNNNSPYTYNYGYPSDGNNGALGSSAGVQSLPSVSSSGVRDSSSVNSFIGAFSKKPELIQLSTAGNSSQLAESHQNPISAASYLSPTYSFTSYNSFRRPDYSIYRSPSVAQLSGFGGGQATGGVPLYRASKSAAAIVQPSTSASSSSLVALPPSAYLDHRPQAHYSSGNFRPQHHHFSHHYHLAQPSHNLHQTPKNQFWEGAATSSSEPQPKLIKFSAKDGKSLTPTGSLGPRESLSETTRKVIQYELPPDALLEHQQPGHHHQQQQHQQQQYRTPRRIKMGSFIKPRSVSSVMPSEGSGPEAKSDGVFIQKYDMSDIFCKTKFKPITSSADSSSMVASVSSLTEGGDGRNGRTLKRSFSSEAEPVAKPVITTFVNSDWTSVTVPKQTNASESSLRRSKRQTRQSPPALSDPSASTTLLNTLPTGTLVKEIDPATTELLLRLLRNNSTSASGEFQRKKITNVYYVYLPNRGRQSTTTSTTTTTTTEAPPPVFIRNNRPQSQRRPTQPSETPAQPRPRRPQPLPQPTSEEELLLPDDEPQFQRRPPLENSQRVQPQPQPQRRPQPASNDGLEDSFRRQNQPQLPSPQSPPPRHQRPPQRNRVPNHRPRPVQTTTTTTTTTTTPAPPSSTTPGFLLTEIDYEFGERLCEGRFRGSVPDPRHDCRLYFTCNPDTIDTFSCPNGYRFDVHTQLCQPQDSVVCPRLKA